MLIPQIKYGKKKEAMAELNEKRGQLREHAHAPLSITIVGRRKLNVKQTQLAAGTGVIKKKTKDRNGANNNEKKKVSRYTYIYIHI